MAENVDKSWMNLRRFEEKYILGIYSFLEFAKNNSVSWNGYYKCPCIDCGNMLFQNEADIIYHLKNVGIMKNYTVWDQHGEVTNIPTASQRRLNMIRDRASSSHNVSPVVQFVEDAFPFRERYNDNESIAEEGNHVPPMRCPIEKEISIIEEIVGPSVGTVVRGMGCLAVRAPRMRGPTKGTSMPVDDLRRKLAEHDEEIRLLKEAQDEAKKEAAEQKKMILTLMQICGVASDANSNSTTSTSKALG